MKSLILPPLGALYAAVTRARASLYERGTFQTFKLERPVVSVGNVTVGGTGKTPMVEWVARTLVSTGQKVCILTRGYGREKANKRVLVSDGTSVFSNPREAGDEPYLLAKHLSGLAAVVSDANRFEAGQGAIKHLGTDYFVLDDGFQHLQLARDLDIVMIDSTNPFGGGQVLPYGRLREPLSALKRADCFVLTRCDQTDNCDEVQHSLNRLSGDRPVFLSRMKTIRLVPLNEAGNSAELSNPVAAFCAVGNPHSFFAHLKKEGMTTELQKSFPDHYNYTQNDIDKLISSAKHVGAQSLVTTAKDAVKLQSLNFSLPCYSLEVEIQIENEPGFRRLLLNSIDR